MVSAWPGLESIRFWSSTRASKAPLRACWIASRTELHSVTGCPLRRSSSWRHSSERSDCIIRRIILASYGRIMASAIARRFFHRRDSPAIGNSIFFQLSVKRGFADAQQFGGHQLVSVELIERGQDGLLFHVGQRQNAVPGAVAGRRYGVNVGTLDLRRQVADVQHRTRPEGGGRL